MDVLAWELGHREVRYFPFPESLGSGPLACCPGLPQGATPQSQRQGGQAFSLWCFLAFAADSQEPPSSSLYIYIYIAIILVCYNYQLTSVVIIIRSLHNQWKQMKNEQCDLLSTYDNALRYIFFEVSFASMATIIFKV